LLAWPAVLASLAVCWGLLIAPAMNSERSTSGFMARALQLAPRDRPLALVAYKEQFLLFMDRETWNFGHRRWREGPQEAYDAAAWLNAASGRVLLLPETALSPCFVSARRTLVGEASRDQWYLVEGVAAAECATKGDAGRAIRYPAHPIG
jgi:hypothetical protein